MIVTSDNFSKKKTLKDIHKQRNHQVQNSPSSIVNLYKISFYINYEAEKQ